MTFLCHPTNSVAALKIDLFRWHKNAYIFGKDTHPVAATASTINTPLSRYVCVCVCVCVVRLIWHVVGSDLSSDTILGWPFCAGNLVRTEWIGIPPSPSTRTTQTPRRGADADWRWVDESLGNSRDKWRWYRIHWVARALLIWLRRFVF